MYCTESPSLRLPPRALPRKKRLSEVPLTPPETAAKTADWQAVPVAENGPLGSVAPVRVDCHATNKPRSDVTSLLPQRQAAKRLMRQAVF